MEGVSCVSVRLIPLPFISFPFYILSCQPDLLSFVTVAAQLQFRPLRSAVNPAFWGELAKRKLHEWRWTTTWLHGVPRISYFTPCLITFNCARTHALQAWRIPEGNSGVLCVRKPILMRGLELFRRERCPVQPILRLYTDVSWVYTPSIWSRIEFTILSYILQRISLYPAGDTYVN